MIWTFLLAALLILVDQLTKIASVRWLPGLPEATYKLWDGVLHLTYVENRGAAFGMLQGARWFFLTVTAIACVFIVWFLIRERRRMHTLMKFSLALILAGAVGNLIDRAVLGYVRDMIYVALIDFAVFNVADMGVCIGCGLLILDILFFKGKTYFDMLEGKDAAVDAPAEEADGMQPEPVAGDAGHEPEPPEDTQG